MNLWANLDGRAIRRHSEEFFDLFVGKRDATDSPICPTMKGTDPPESVSNSVNHDIETGRDAPFCDACLIIIRRIRNVQREVKTALRISAIDLVDSFRCFHVPFCLLRAHWVPT